MELNAEDRKSRTVRLRDLSTVDAIRVTWWRLGITPTARVRRRRFAEGIQDGRGRQESLRIARSSGVY